MTDINVYYITGFGLPSVLTVAPINPHCFEISWMRGSGPVTEHRVYCFPGDSQKADVVKFIQDVNEQSSFISGLKPETVYRVGITSVCSGTESRLVLSKKDVKLRMFVINIFKSM